MFYRQGACRVAQYNIDRVQPEKNETDLIKKINDPLRRVCGRNAFNVCSRTPTARARRGNGGRAARNNSINSNTAIFSRVSVSRRHGQRSFYDE